MRKWAMVLLIGLLTGCTNQPTSHESSTPVKADRVYVSQAGGGAIIRATRDSGPIGALGVLTLYIDGVKMADFYPGESMDIPIASGDHILSVGASMSTPAEMTASIKDGARLNVRLTIGFGGLGIMPTAF